MSVPAAVRVRLWSPARIGRSPKARCSSRATGTTTPITPPCANGRRRPITTWHGDGSAVGAPTPPTSRTRSGPSRQPLSGGHLGPVASQRPDRRHEGRHGVCPAGKRHQSGVHHHYRLGGSRRDRRRLPEQPPERGVFRLEARMGHSVGLAGRRRHRRTGRSGSLHPQIRPHARRQRLYGRLQRHRLDHEPNVGGAGCKRELSNRDNFYIFVDELGKYLGPKSGTDKLLVIDGEINAVEGRCMPYFDYFIWQAYSTSSDSGLNTYISTVIRNGSGYMEPEEPDPQALHHGQLRTIRRRGRRLLHGRHQPASGAGSLETHMGGQDLPQGRIRLLPHRIRILSVRQIGLLSVDPASHQRRTSVRERRRGSERITE